MKDFSKLLLIVLKSIIMLCEVNPVLSYKYISAPGCPADAVWLLDNNNNCHKVNTRGPCGKNMLFFPNPNSVDKLHGFCDCFDARMNTEEEIDLINNRELSGCLNDVRSQIFVPERNRCYSAFHQGPCPIGKWLVLNETYYPVCAKNHCLTSKPETTVTVPDPLSTRFQFAHSGTDKCYETMTKGYCPKLYRLRFSFNDWVPKCRYSPSQSQSNKHCPLEKQHSAQTIFRSRCKPGSRRNYLYNCTYSLNPR